MDLGSNSTKKRYSTERGFLSKLLETKDFKTVKEQQIKSSFFTGDSRRVFQYVSEMYSRSGEVPTQRAVNHKFPNFMFEMHDTEAGECVGTDESLLYWCEQLRVKNTHNRTAETCEEVARKLEEGKPEEAFDFMRKSVWDIQSDVEVTTSVDITKDTEDRKLAYIERRSKRGMLGIPTGIEHLDYLLKGLQNETLTTLIAQTGIGKTWFEVLIGAYASLNNYRVINFLTEMSADIMRDRYEAMLYGMMYGDFNYQMFKSGTLSSEQEQGYFKFLENDLPRVEPVILETATGVSSIVTAIQQHDPDLVLIDGVYLMQDERGARDDWLRVAHITRDIKQVAKQWHKPIFVNSQADENTSKKTGPKLGDIKYTQAIGQDSDNVLALYRDAVMVNDREMGISVLKQREGTLGRVTINWDFQHMNFSGIYSDTDDGSDDSIDADNEKVIGIE